MQATYEIEVLAPGQAEQRVTLDGWRPLRVGRDPHADVVVAHDAVAPFHADIVPGPRRCLVEVRAPLWLDGAALVPDGRDVPLPDQCELRLGVSDGPLVRVRRLAYAAPVGEPLLTAARLSVGGVLRDVDLSLRAGELVAVLGRSGSGKTTLLRCLAGLVARDAGELTLAEGKRVGFVPQRDPLLPELTPRQAIGFAARLQRDAPAPGLAARVVALADELGFADALDQRCGTLSGGQARRVSIATVLVGAPDVLLLDEPDSGLDPYHSGQLMAALSELAGRRGIAIALTTHSLLHQNLMHRVVVLRAGEVLAQGPPPEVAAEFGVRDLHRVYQGLGADAPRPLIERFGGPRAAPAPARRLSLRRGWALLERALFRRVVEPAAASALLLPLLLGLVIRLVWWSTPAGMGSVPGAVAMARLGLAAGVWLGLTAAVQALVGVRDLHRQEVVHGVALRELLAAEGLALLVLAGGQALLLAAVLCVGSWLAPGVLAAGLVVGAACGVALGLAVSAWAPSPQVALRAVPLLMIPQLLFGSLTGFPLAVWTPEWVERYVAPLAFTPALEALFGDADALRNGFSGGLSGGWMGVARPVWHLVGLVVALIAAAFLGVSRLARPDRRPD